MTLPADGESATVKVRFTANEAGRAALPVQGADRRPASRSRRTTRATRSIEVNDRREKVLYFEGEPRFEMKFIRRAVEDDKNLQVTILAAHRREQSTGAATSATRTSCSAAFRRRARSCSRYRAIILGSVEAASFTPEQLRMLADFVSKRGGGLLMLGGRRLVRRGRLGRHAGRRSAAGRHRERERRSTSPSCRRGRPAPA